ncbi:MAG: aspartate-semialdehyde dehydrogenase [Candidatus Eisenbacteria bacterium]|nr:aspartate-semialdehyde dehydrogenase [Candidatus Eisenbacteria bacterium]
MNSKGWRIGVVGATGAVGRCFLSCLETTPIPITELRLFATPRSVGTRLPFRGEERSVVATSEGGFSGLDCVLLSAGAAASKQWAPAIRAAGAWAVDNSSQFRMDSATPLVVPEVNAASIPAQRRLIANPNCSTIQLVVALKPLLDRFGLARVFVATYQSASGKGQIGVDALREEMQGGRASSGAFPRTLLGNVIPEAGTFLEDGWTTEEEKLLFESRKILGRAALVVHPTCVRVPVEIAHSEAVYVELEQEATRDAVAAALREAPGLVFADSPDAYATALEAAGRDPVYVGRLRADRCSPRGFHFWVVADNLRKGAARNAVQIAEHLHARESAAQIADGRV